MATYKKLGSQIKVAVYDFDPDTTGQTDVGWVDMQDYNSFMAVLFHSVGTTAINEFKILANTATDGSGTETTVKSHALGTAPDAVGDYVFLECSAEEIGGLGDDLRGVSAAIGLDGATDECVVVYILGNPKRAADGMCSDVIA